MAINKFEFIKELLNEKRLNSDPREKILLLASREISTEGALEDRVQKIEELLFNNYNIFEIEEFEKEKKMLKTNNLPEYLHPYHLYKFLFEYNQNPVLRTTCHEIDINELNSILEFCDTPEYLFQKHLELIILEYNRHEKKYPAPFSIKALIRGYLTGKDYNGNFTSWSSKNINFNWSSKELFDWSILNLKIPPNSNSEFLRSQKIKSFKIDPQVKSPVTEKVIQNFTQLVLHFKNLFHVKSGAQSLKEIFSRVNTEKNWNAFADFDIDNEEFSEKLEHFVDLEKLIQAYNKVIELIIEQNKGDSHPKIKLKYFQLNEKVYFCIHHINGIYNKTIENTIERIGQTYTSLIKYQINGLCNFYLKAQFENGENAEINLWDSLDRRPLQIPKFQGVEHIFEFPKKLKQ
jgi:hypothetical protein